MRKISSSHSNTLHVTGLDELDREQIEEPREKLVSNDLRERDLSQSEESENEETLKFRSIQSIYDETNLICFESSLFSAEEPSSYSLAAKQEVWRNAIKDEISAILRNNTWTVVKPNKEISPIGVKWVFQAKKDNMGKVVRHKARLVVKGYAQKQGIDYDEVFSPIARMESIKILIAIAAQENWELHHLDVKTAFLNREIKEDIYINQPKGFLIKGKEDHIDILY